MVAVNENALGSTSGTHAPIGPSHTRESVRVAAVVVTYNRCKLLVQCIEHLRVQRLPVNASLDIVVVDNASTDDTLYYLADYIGNGTVKYYNTGANLGGAGGFAIGMQVAVDLGYDLLWVMDDDCLPDPDALYALLAASEKLGGPAQGTPGGSEQPDSQAKGTPGGSEQPDDLAQDTPGASEQPGVQAQGTQAPSVLVDGPAQGATPSVTSRGADDDGASEVQAQLGSASSIHADGGWGYLSSVVRWKDGAPCAMNVQRHPLYNNIEDFTSEVQPCTLASFVSLLVPAGVVREVGLPHAEFFIWTDDWEFTRRISRKYPCYVVGGSHVLHASETNNPGNIFTDPPERLDRYAYIYRNDVVLYREEGLRGKLFPFVRGVYHTLRVLASDVDEKRRRIGLIWSGTREGFAFHPETHFPDSVNKG